MPWCSSAQSSSLPAAQRPVAVLHSEQVATRRRGEQRTMHLLLLLRASPTPALLTYIECPHVGLVALTAHALR